MDGKPEVLSLGLTGRDAVRVWGSVSVRAGVVVVLGLGSGPLNSRRRCCIYHESLGLSHALTLTPTTLLKQTLHHIPHEIKIKFNNRVSNN